MLFFLNALFKLLKGTKSFSRFTCKAGRFTFSVYCNFLLPSSIPYLWRALEMILEDGPLWNFILDSFLCIYGENCWIMSFKNQWQKKKNEEGYSLMALLKMANGMEGFSGRCKIQQGSIVQTFPRFAFFILAQYFLTDWSLSQLPPI